ncbi:MAG: ribulose-phosphate 3-epimerase [Oligoflexales bacterium]
MANEKLFISPSILSANPLHLGQELAEVEQAGADYHHVDVMDGHFVPNLTFGPPLIRAIKKVAKIPLDVHIMVSNPEETAHQYLEAGADILTFHVEATGNAEGIIDRIHKHGRKAGIAISPATPISLIEGLIAKVDLINVMSVNPGFGGQKYIGTSHDKVRAIKDLTSTHAKERKIFIEVDGGIDDTTAKLVVDAGANMLVAGSFIYGSETRSQRINLLRKLGAHAR